MAEKTWRTGEWVHRDVREHFERMFPDARVSYDPAEHSAEENAFYAELGGELHPDVILYTVPSDENGVPLSVLARDPAAASPYPTDG